MLTQIRLKELLNYNTETGIFTWIKSNFGVTLFSNAGTINSHGYVKIKIDGKSYNASRLAFLYINGKFPNNQVDHINGIRSDNSYINLRDVTHSGNGQNKKIALSFNKTKLLGVSFYKAGNNYQASIGVNNRKKHLGYFDTAEDAHNAYVIAKRIYHPTNTL